MYDKEAHEKAAAEARRVGWLREPLTMGRPPEGPYQVGVRCSEAVLEGLQQCCPQVSKAQFDWLADVTMGLGAGFSGMGEVCGAVTGHIIAIGIDTAYRTRETAMIRKEVSEATRRYCTLFKEKFGALRCADLTGLNFLKSDGSQNTDAWKEFGSGSPPIGERCLDFIQFSIYAPLPSEEG